MMVLMPAVNLKIMTALGAFGLWVVSHHGDWGTVSRQKWRTLFVASVEMLQLTRAHSIGQLFVKHGIFDACNVHRGPNHRVGI